MEWLTLVMVLELLCKPFSLISYVNGSTLICSLPYQTFSSSCTGGKLTFSPTTVRFSKKFACSLASGILLKIQLIYFFIFCFISVHEKPRSIKKFKIIMSQHYGLNIKENGGLICRFSVCNDCLNIFCSWTRLVLAAQSLGSSYFHYQPWWE